MSLGRKRLALPLGDRRIRDDRYRLRKRISAPTDIPNCALWLDAQLGVTATGKDAVTGWADQSVNSRDFTASGPRDWLVGDWSSGTWMKNWTAVHSGVLYISDIDENTSTPGVANWTSLEVSPQVGGVRRLYEAGETYNTGDAIMFKDGGLYRPYQSDSDSNTGNTPNLGSPWSQVSLGSAPLQVVDSSVAGLNTIVFDADYSANTGNRMDTGLLSTPFGQSASTWFCLYKRSDYDTSATKTHNFIVDCLGGNDKFRRVLRISGGQLLQMQWGSVVGQTYGTHIDDRWVLAEAIFRDLVTADDVHVWRNGIDGGIGLKGGGGIDTVRGIILGDRNAHADQFEAWFDGSIAVLVAYDGVVNSSNQRAVREYIFDRYSLSGVDNG